MYLLDTNTLIYFFRREGRVADRLKSVPPGELFIPTVVLFELEHGVLRSTKPAIQRQGIDAALQTHTVLDFDYACAKSAAWIKHTLEVAGTPISHYDQLIAGIALTHDLTVVTRNTREFTRVPGLRVVNWYD